MRKFLLYTGFLISFSGAIAQADTLEEAMSYAYENSSTLNASRASLRATDENVAIAKSGYRPNVTGNASVGKTYNRATFENNILPLEELHETPKDVSVKMVQPVFSGLTTYNSVKSAETMVKSGQEKLSETEQNKLLEVATAYMDVIKDKSVLELNQNNVKVLTRHLESVKKRFAVGSLTRTDVAQSEARLSGAKAKLIAAEAQLKVSEAVYRDAVGKEAKDLTDVNGKGLDLPKTLDEAVEFAEENNPRIKAADYAQKSYEKQISVQKGELLPSVDIIGQAGHFKDTESVDDGGYWSLTANLSVPLYQGGADYAKVRQAKHIANQYRLQARSIRTDIWRETVTAWEYYQSAKAEIVAVKAQVKAAETALQGVIREEKAGTRTVLDVLNAEQEHLNSQVSYQEAHRNEIVSAYSLLAKIGKLTPDTLGLAVKPYDSNSYYDAVKNKWIGYNI